MRQFEAVPPIDTAVPEVKSRPHSKGGTTAVKMLRASLGIMDEDLSTLHIYQDFIDSMCETNLSADFDGWCDLWTLPYVIHLEDIDKVVDDHAITKDFFDMLLQNLERRASPQMTRVADSAERVGPDEIVGYHTAYITSENAEDAWEPVISRLRLVKRRGRWRATEVTNSLKNAEFPYNNPEFSDGLQITQVIEERMRNKS